MALSVAVGALAMVPLIGFVTTVWPPSNIPLGTLHQPAYAAFPILATACRHNLATPTNRIVVITTLNNLDVQDGTVSLNIGLCVGRSVSSSLRSDKCKPTLTFSIPGEQTPLPQSVPVAARAPVEKSSKNAYQPIGETTANLAGDPTHYPLDTYLGLLQWSITVRDAPDQKRKSKRAPVQSSKLTGTRAANCNFGSMAVERSAGLGKRTFTSATYVAAGASGLEWMSERHSIRAYPNARAHQMTFAGTLQFGGTRPLWTTKLFVAALVFVLAILVGALIFRMFSEPPLRVDTIAIVGAMLIAVLPVRAVLVPAAIGSLVLVDYALAFLMAALVAGLIIAQRSEHIRAKPDDGGGGTKTSATSVDAND